MEFWINRWILQLILSSAIIRGHIYRSHVDVPFEYRTTSDNSYEQIEVRNIRNSRSVCDSNNTIAICVSMNLTNVPDYLNPDITYFDLSYNHIHSLKKDLAKYSKLKYLNLKKNGLCILDNENFVNLGKLIHLNLQENCIAMDSTFPSLVFKPLTSLSVLKMNYNNKDLSRPDLAYPDKALSFLLSLNELYIDGLLNTSFGDGFKTMQSLTKLTITGPQNARCTRVVITNSTFINFANLNFLNLSSCCLDGRNVDSRAFLPLKNLQHLDISRNPQGCLNDLLDVFQGLKQSKLTFLRMTGVINPYSTCVMISKAFVMLLPRFLMSLEARSNSFETIEDGSFDNLPTTLTYLDLGDNEFNFGAYLKNFSKLENLKTLSLDGETIASDLPTDFPDNSGMCSYSSEPTSKITHRRRRAEDRAILKLPKNLDTVNIEFAGWSYTLSNFTIDANNSLIKLSLSGNNFPNLQGPITGLTQLNELDLAQCNIYTISETFFDNFPSLEILNLSSNFFGPHSLSTGQNPRFQNLTNLKYLDLSFVNILVISKRAFDGLISLQKLWLHNNAFYYFDVHISHLINLNFIDFRFTEMVKLNDSTMNDLNNIYIKNKELMVDFTETPVHCYCENLLFIEKFIQYEWFAKNLTRYKCVFLDTSEKYMPSFNDIYHLLNKQCTPETMLFVAVLIGIILVICFIALSIGYRFRWKLRYLYHSAYINLKLQKNQIGTDHEFKYDVFLSYDSEDQDFILNTLSPELTSRGLRVHVHLFDFVAGEFIASNIVSAIQSSRRTLVVLTSHMLDSFWCKYELQMANMEAMHTDRRVLVFLLMENLTKKEMGTELLYHIQNNTYIPYPEQDQQHPEVMEAFWRKVVDDLQAR